ncbi:hypothetical protein M422DRAFT_254691 [Sphaerobolus stellatus SS14]|uniref:Unplaced genomic scaffold SPHSTscaffold_56, whole genome shotgun sequence n=1 Tax=Sphaerobolus stellatus (strain SS14) TaxID=990650 RepID=A0A0C9VVG9_SPHS4|nr:hypothetical protein M422DRAFT_254691 [Sphaerobolus stellatus SS14]
MGRGRGVSHLEYRDEDASRNVEEADAKQQPRNKRRIAVRLSLSYPAVYWRCVWWVPFDIGHRNVSRCCTDIARFDGERAVLYVNATFDGTEDSVDLARCIARCRRKASVRPPTLISGSLDGVNANGITSPSHKLITLHQIRLRSTIELGSRSFISLVLVQQTPSSDKSSMRIMLDGNGSSGGRTMEIGGIFPLPDTVGSPLTRLGSGTAAVDEGDTRLKCIPPVRQ